MKPTPLLEYLYAAALRADEAWSRELEKRFGDEAGDARYDARGRSTLALSDLGAIKLYADREWLTALDAARWTPPPESPPQRVQVTVLDVLTAMSDEELDRTIRMLEQTREGRSPRQKRPAQKEESRAQTEAGRTQPKRG